MPALSPTDVMRTIYGHDWDPATRKARTGKAKGAGFHRTKREDVWWVDPVPKDPPPKTQSTYWVTQYADGCYSCVCTTFLEDRSPPSPCCHIARVCLEIGVTPKIWTENPSCTGGHDDIVTGYTKEDLSLPREAGQAVMPLTPRIAPPTALDSSTLPNTSSSNARTRHRASWWRRLLRSSLGRISSRA